VWCWWPLAASPRPRRARCSATRPGRSEPPLLIHLYIRYEYIYTHKTHTCPRTYLYEHALILSCRYGQVHRWDAQGSAPLGDLVE
jgi:hypothetical protein